ncbi:MAG TPA: UPF0146 family protein [Methanocorpusculum sp.]|nr:UPF0146 family protein [Methanocorpusculum sp.]
MVYDIERAVGLYIKSNYSSAVEIGFGGKTIAAEIVQDAGMPILCTDIRAYDVDVPSVIDDCTDPDISLYTFADVIYAIRPGTEIVPNMIKLAEKLNVDLIIYHLGFEIYLDGGEIIETGGIQLHRYVRKKI